MDSFASDTKNKDNKVNNHDRLPNDKDDNKEDVLQHLLGFLNKDKIEEIVKHNYIYETEFPTDYLKLKHNLNSTDLLIQIWIKDKNNFYYNDFTPIKIIDNNNIEIILTEKNNFKVIIQNSPYNQIKQKAKELSIPIKIFEKIRQYLIKL